MAFIINESLINGEYRPNSKNPSGMSYEKLY